MLATLSEVKSYLDITDTNSDTLLTSLLNAADALVKSYTGRDFEENTYTHYFNGKGENEFLLKQYPVSVLTSLQYNTGSFSVPVRSNFNVDTYKLEGDNGRIWTMFPIYKGIQNIKVVYTAGYAPGSIPLEINQVVVQLTALYFNGSKSDGITSENVDGTGVVYDKTIPNNIRLILNKYKNVQTF